MRVLISLLKPLIEMVNYLFNRITLYTNQVVVGENLRINGRIYIRNQGILRIGSNVTITSGPRYNPIGGDELTQLIVRPGAVLEILDNVGISNSTIVAHERITIESNVLIGGSCSIWDTDFHAVDPVIRSTPGDRGKSKPVVINSNAFIGARSIILKGASIGRAAVLGAGTVTSELVGDNEIWIGNPAKYVRKIR